jgi:anaerobic selenocysteine-containing dehydrogenase
VLAARNAARHNSLNVVSRASNMTSRFASIHLSGSERAGMLELVAAAIEARGGAQADWEKALVKDVNPGANARRLAKSFLESDQSVVLLSTSDPVVGQLANALVKAVGDAKRLFTLHDYGNARGIAEIFVGGTSVEDVLGSANRGEIDIAVILGADLVASHPSLDVSGALSNVKMVVAGAPFPNKTTGLAHLVLPTALWIETDGTFNSEMRRAAVEPPGGALSYGDILNAIARAMGVELRAPAPKKALVAGQLDQPTAAALADAAREAEAVPGVESTAIRFADGSLTDRVSWAKMVEKSH